MVHGAVKVDFYGPLPSGMYLLTVADEYSRWVEVEAVFSTSARATIPKLDKIFTMYGIPYKLTSDNGPPFQGAEMKQFSQHMGIIHRRITPLWPKANSTVEGFNRYLRKVMQSANLEGKNWRQELNAFLRTYRVTPHTSTGKSPAELMFNSRNYRTRLPVKQLIYDDHEVREKDKLRKEQMKMYADRKSNVKECDINVGDTVLVKQRKLNKLTTPFSTVRYIVTETKGSMITAVSEETKKFITRNSSFFKKVPNNNTNKKDENNIDITEDVPKNLGNHSNIIYNYTNIEDENTNTDQLEDLGDHNTIEDEIQVPIEVDHEIPRRNPVRERLRPLYLRDDVTNLLNT